MISLTVLAQSVYKTNIQINNSVLINKYVTQGPILEVNYMPSVFLE